MQLALMHHRLLIVSLPPIHRASGSELHIVITQKLHRHHQEHSGYSLSANQVKLQLHVSWEKICSSGILMLLKLFQHTVGHGSRHLLVIRPAYVMQLYLIANLT